MGEGVSNNVPAADGEADFEMALLELGRGLLDSEGDTDPEAVIEGLGDTVRVPAAFQPPPPPPALGVTLEDTDTEREERGLFDVEELVEGEGNTDPDFPPDLLALSEAEGLTLVTVADTD